MKKYFFILITLFNNISFSQTIFTYEVNIFAKEKKISENFDLLITKSKSYYYNSIQQELDSLREVYSKQNDLLGYQAESGNYPRQKLKYKIIKNNDNYDYELKSFSSYLQYNEKIPFLDWKIFNVYDTIANYKCQKAETFYEGRKYTAWFTIEIPINNGPYIFQGLPGLITKIVREDTGYEIKLIGIKNQKSTFLPELTTDKVIKVKKEDLIKAYIGTFKEILNKVSIVSQEQEKNVKSKINKLSEATYLYEF